METLFDTRVQEKELQMNELAVFYWQGVCHHALVAWPRGSQKEGKRL